MGSPMLPPAFPKERVSCGRTLCSSVWVFGWSYESQLGTGAEQFGLAHFPVKVHPHHKGAQGCKEKVLRLIFFLWSQSQWQLSQVGGGCLHGASWCPNSSWSVRAALVKCLVLGQWEVLAALEQLLVQLPSHESQCL